MSHSVRTFEDLEYAHVPSGALCLDLHRPQADIESPCVVYFHGGGWLQGDRKAAMYERVHPVVDRGIAVASVSYRFTDVATHPAQLDDARAAVAWLRDHASEFGLRGDRIGSWGASAGGWIALMLALTPAATPSEAVQAACAWFPTTDLTTAASDREAAGLPMPEFMQGRALPVPSFEARLLGAQSVADVPEAALAASPISHAGTTGAPVLLIHGDADGLMSDRQSRRLHDALLAAGADAQLLLIAGANHEGPEFHTPAVLGAVAAFFQANL